MNYAKTNSEVDEPGGQRKKQQKNISVCPSGPKGAKVEATPADVSVVKRD